MGGALEVSASGYHAWAARPDSPTEEWRREPVGPIGQIHAEVKRRYGSPRMTAELNARGYECSENTAAELMREHGIRARAPRWFVRTTDSNCRLPAAENPLTRDFAPAGPNESWRADITYTPAGEGGCARRWSRTCSAGRWRCGRWPRRRRAGWSPMPWGWRSADGSRARGWWPTRTGGAGPPATTTSGC
ncbi:MAG: IS3 family transposase [Gemmataceae bacterium]|nr:IS3 family transposase [Gemmataceae bacterium]